MTDKKTSPVAKPIAAAVLAALLMAPSAYAQSTTAPEWLDWDSDTQPPTDQPARTAEQPASPSTPENVVEESVAVEAITSDRREQLEELAFEQGQAELIQRMMARIERLEQQVTQLRGTVSEQERHIAQLQRSELPVDQPTQARAEFDAELDTIDGEIASTTTRVGLPDQPELESEAALDDADTSSAERSDVVSDEEQQQLYNQAFEILTEGRYEEAIAAFEAVVDANPEGPWVSSALFWQGETYYVEQRRDEARAVYQQLIAKFPDSNRIADARLKLGYIAYDEQDFDQARVIFEQVVEEHPDHQAAGLAQQRLSRIERMN